MLRRADERGRSRGAGGSVRLGDGLLLALLAAAIRLPTLGDQSFWLDEGYTERLVHMTLGGMLARIPATESTPPFYYLLAWAWTHLLGYSEFAIRSLSALAGAGTVIVVYAIAARLAGRRAGLLAGAIATLSPMLVWFSQEARAYSLATLLSTVSVYGLIRFLQSRRGRWLGLWLLAACLSVATHYFAAFIALPALAILLHTRRAERRVWAAGGCLVATLAALAPLALRQRGTGHADYLSQSSLVLRLLQIPKQFLVGYASPHQLIASLVLAVSIAAALAVLPRAMRGRTLVAVRLPLALGALCIVLPVSFALGGLDYLNTRNLLPALPLLIVAVAAVIAAVPGAAAPLLSAGVLAASAAVTLLVATDARYQRDDWRGISEAIGRWTPAGARILLITPASGSIPLSFYRPGLRPMSGAMPVREVDAVAIASRALGEGERRAPRLGGSVAPPGFKLASAEYAPAYSVVRYTVPRPVVIAGAELARSHLGSGAYAIESEQSAVARAGSG